MLKKARFLCLCFCLLCIIGLNPVTVHGAYVTNSGQAGDDAIWELDNEGTLTFSGTGSLYGAGITSGYSPWGKFSGYVVKKVVVKEGITSLGGHDTFSQCPELETAILPDSLESICRAAFKWCPKLKSIKLGKNLKTIDGEAFRGDSSLESISLPEGLTNLGPGALAGTGIRSIVIPKSYDGDFKDTTGDYCGVFSSCGNLESIVILGKVHSASSYFISGCSSLRYIIFTGDAPDFSSWPMKGAPVCTAIYPAGNATWVGNLASNGNVRWLPSSLDGRKIVSAVSTSSGMKLTWDAFPEVSGFYIYKKADGGSWTKIRTISDPLQTTYTDKTAVNGAKVQYKVCPCIAVPGITLEYKNSPAKTALYLTSPKISSVVNTASGLKLSWSKNAKASGYYIYRKKGTGSWTKIKTITSASTVSYADSKASYNGSKYSYRVYAYKTLSGKTYKSAASAAVSQYRLSRPAISKLSNPSAGKMKAEWNKNAKASGYQVQYSTRSSFSTVKSYTVSGYRTVSKTCSNLSKNVRYYVRVRSYKTVSSKKQYSAWSTTSNILIRK